MSESNKPVGLKDSEEIEREIEAPPTFQKLCLEVPLYQSIPLDQHRDENWLWTLRYGGIQFDAHCVYCGEQSTFRTFRKQVPGDVALAQKRLQLEPSTHLQQELKRLIFEGGRFAVHMACQRKGHLYGYYFVELGSGVMKFGQFPSLEDVAGSEIEKYRKILGDSFAEMRKAGGLVSHGIGIGAFVYLRRIFEKLIEEARKAADPQDEHKDEFNKLRMSERIGALADELPASVVEFKDAYGILSKGLHELTEEECKKHFPVVRAAIFMMLEDRYEAQQKKSAAEELKRAVQAAAQETSNR